MTTDQNSERPVSSTGRPASGPLVPAQPGRAVTGRAAARPGLAAMLEARTVALVGASPRPGTFGQRMVDEVTKSPSRPEVYLVNPRYSEIAGRRCVPSLAGIPGPVDLVLLAVPDVALEEQLTLAARRGDRSAVIFGNAHEDPAPTPNSGPTPTSGLPSPGASGASPAWVEVLARSSEPKRTTTQDPQPGGRGDGGDGGLGYGAGALRDRLAAIARGAGMQLCGAGCMGFVNVARGLRAIGYTEPDPLPAGSVALVTHSGSVFSAMLRARRGFGYTLAVSSGQELVTPAAAYLDYAIGLPETKVLALVLEAIREPHRLRSVLGRAAERDIPVVLLTVGRSASGRMMVNAHSGALAADDGGWEALARAYGVHRAGDLAELADTVELFAVGRRAARGRAQGAGIATVHDSGLERAHAADLAEDVGVPFATIGAATKARLAEILDPGLIPANPLDVWGTGADTRDLFCESLIRLAGDPSVGAVALAVDLVRELDGDDSYPLAVLDAAARTIKPVAVLGNLASAVDRDVARQLRENGVPVLEGLRPGLLALGHLLDHADRSPAVAPGLAAAPNLVSYSGPVTAENSTASGRRERAAALLAAGPSGPPLLALLRDYGIATAETTEAASLGAALAAAEAVGYPVVLKTANPAVSHKSDARGVILGIRDPAELARAYADLSARLGPRVLVCQTVPPGPELAVGIARDPDLGPLIVVGAGGVLVELLADRSVALPPVDERTARQMIGELRAARLLAGVRGAPPADLDAVVRAITSVSALAEDLGDKLAALDVNPLICGPDAAVAVDALAVLRADG
ncbi:MAG TPA: acetate--CoA ligase family protein [Streptosporangiaceae bacterium]|nr:acetate--CoA ligase family protein [Streptosporangiaceae bacterium]